MEIKLDKDSYNKLAAGAFEGDCLLLVEKKEEKICLIYEDDYGEDIKEIPVVNFDCESSEGKVFSNCVGCLIDLYISDDIIYPSIECSYCMNEIDCKKHSLKAMIKEISFIDPIPHRNRKDFYHLKELLEILQEEHINNEYEKIKEINHTMQTLETQIEEVLNEWSYGDDN